MYRLKPFTVASREMSASFKRIVTGRRVVSSGSLVIAPNKTRKCDVQTCVMYCLVSHCMVFNHHFGNSDICCELFTSPVGLCGQQTVNVPNVSIYKTC